MNKLINFIVKQTLKLCKQVNAIPNKEAIKKYAKTQADFIKNNISVLDGDKLELVYRVNGKIVKVKIPNDIVEGL